MHSLKETLEKLYKKCNFHEKLTHDPIEFPHRYSNPEDIEIAGFIASCLAYGKIELFKPVIEKILRPMGRHPFNFLMDFTLRDKEYFKDINYRFNREKDIICLIYLLSKVLKKWNSLKNLFYHYYNPIDEDIKSALNSFINSFLTIDTSPIYGKDIKPYGLTQFFPSPKRGSACKRMNLFLRWMVRNRDIDLGIWDRIPPSKLIIPLDTHIARISRCLGLTERTTIDWKTAKEITDALKRFDPVDPLKYDFVLCHEGVSGVYKKKNL